MSTSIQVKISGLLARIQHFEQEYAREAGSVQLLAVSKTRSDKDIRQAFEAKQHQFGENYLQEALDKQAKLRTLPLIWHFIGPIQSNKTRLIAENFDWVHSLNRLKIAQRLSEQRPPELPNLKVLIQVNLDAEASKSGVSLASLPQLAITVAALPRLDLVGLMTIPAPTTNTDTQRQIFQQLRQARDNLQKAGLKQCTDLSMGMSADIEAAIAEGATWVRIGTDIFGPRG